MSTALEPILEPGTTAADKVATLARVAGLKDVIKEREDAVRADLETDVRNLADAAGGKFTLRCDAGTAYLAGGDPKLTIVDREALASWLTDEEPSLVAWTDRVEVLDHAAAAGIIDHASKAGNDLYEDGVLDALFNLASRCLKVVREPLFDTDVLNRLLASDRYVVSDDRIVHVDTGQPLPGVEVRTSRQTLTVKPAKEVREKVASSIRGDLALTGGDA